jgi:hypothetical protein
VIVRGDILIGQGAHAWVSGQLARAWGAPGFPRPEPWEAVCLAAEQHDVGWAEADLAPLLHPESGRPRSFMQMPRPLHLRIWRTAPRRLLSVSRHAALLVSLHGTGLYERFNASGPEVEEFLAEQRALQTLLDDGTDAEAVAQGAALVRALDELSLALCLPRLPWEIEDVPHADGPVPLRVERDPGGAITVDPWPFARGSLSLSCEARVLEGTFYDEPTFYATFAAAPWTTLRWALRPRTSVPAGSRGLTG